MTRLLRFVHLKERQIVQNWPQLRRMVERYGFPPGLLLGPNTRAWREDEVEQWLASRPTAPKPEPRKSTAHKSAIEIAVER
ncbi:helix-turn-helix transcriptional regulator [Sinorhizobium fredii]|uniref:helix-turn-helix transcriptional regulator n=1 Tax=Rhizobium fredii TaxID=380 RepID=UPI001319C1A2|nr:AlpA family phage regulatory protein [Sinorhizobium fredii]